MSINVNVSGNPVSIRRGQMFMSDIDTFKKKETQRRRKARIEQVRQQSKDVAHDIRNRHRKTASETVSSYDNLQQSALQKWTAKKLLNLQEQYNECLNSIGDAHRQAANEESPERILSQQRKHNSTKARERGRKAWQQMEKEEAMRDAEKQKSLQRKLVSRNLENIRSTLVSRLNKTPKKKKKKRKDENKPSQNRCEKTYRVPQSKSPSTGFRCTEECTCRNDDCYVPGEDNRLSKLIQNRLQTGYNPDDYEPLSPRPCVRPHELPPPVEVEHINITDDSALKEHSTEHPVDHYDHNNRYSHRYTPKEQLVEKHPKMVDKAILFPTEEERKEWEKLNKERERAAQRRGREAMRKEKLKRDHERLLQDLSKLHKEEQLYNAYTRKVDGHLSEERLNEKQSKRQQDLEQAFENIYSGHTPLITLEPVDNDRRKQLPTKDLPGPDEDPQVNVAEWELNEAPDRTSQELDSLRELLERVATQRELLRQEITNLQQQQQPQQTKSQTSESSKRTPKGCPCTKKKRPIRKTSTSTTPSRIASGSSKLPSTSAMKTTESTSTGIQVSLPSVIATTETSTDQRTSPAKSRSPPKFKYNTDRVKVSMKENEQFQSPPKDGIVLQPSGSSLSGIQIIIKVNDPSTSKSSSKSTSTSTCLDMKETSTSTSYYSPPEQFTVEKTHRIKVNAQVHPRRSPPTISIQRPSPKSIPQQTPSELSIRTKQMIEKLLAMSRQSIENLGVSSSEVATPDLAIVDTSANLIGNTSRSMTMSSEEIILDDIFSRTPSTGAQSNEERLSAGGTDQEYRDLAAFCSKRIDRLTEMIQKVRNDTQKLYEINPEETAQTTYMDLPSQSTSSRSDSLKSPQAEKAMNLVMELFRRNQVQTNTNLQLPASDVLHLVEHQSQQQTNLAPPEKNHKKPPVTQNGATTARELSTIVEDITKMGTITEVEVELEKESEHVSIPKSSSSPSSSVHELIVEVGSDCTPDAADVQITPSGKIVDRSKSSTSDSLDDALKQLGLGWAITTLRKTKQTLQLSSTSSASSSSSSINADVSLKRVLQQQMKKRIERSSSTSMEISPEIRELLEYIPATSQMTTNILQQIETDQIDNVDDSKQLLKTVEQLLAKTSADNGRTSTPMLVKTPPDNQLFVNQISDISVISKKESASSSSAHLTVPNLSLDLSKIHSTTSRSTSTSSRR